MSKVDELRIKYPKVTKVTFNKFVDADYTPTKKYLEFMIKTWVNKPSLTFNLNVSLIVNVVKKFDTLLPYIENKDIYHKDYADFSLLIRVIENAEILKDEKTFIREDHVNVLADNDRYILLQPTTHRGSLKYGAGTKWCTASKNSPDVFDKYTKKGCLVYLIDKTNTFNYDNIFIRTVIAGVINILNDRLNMLLNYDFIDYIILYDEIDDLLESELDNIMNIIDPKTWFKGSDYKKEDIIKKHPSLKNINLIDLIDGKSTTIIINKIKKNTI